jgi:D-alanyl-D-alanine carboxypeptidase
MMLPSGNDAAHAIARSLGAIDGTSDQESYRRFIDLMNERIANMGLQNTHFMNPHGWGVENHYSTARDVATFMMYALSFPEFRQIIGADFYTTSNGDYTVSNTNRLLMEGYSGLIGGKTGYDDDAGYCLIEVAQRGDATLISVTLDGMAPDIWYQDHVQLLDTAFGVLDQRSRQGGQIEGERLSYRDPDAASLVKTAQSGGSIGEAPGISAGAAIAQPADTASNVAADSVSDAPRDEPADGGSGLALGGSTVGVIAVALLIATVAAFKALSGRRAARSQPAS